jgi:hypothetical protein
MRIANSSIKWTTSWFRPVLQFLLIFVATDPVGLTAQAPSVRPALPVDPIVAIVDAFRSHSLVGLGEPHRNEQAHRLRVALIRDERFARVVDDIVVEFGDARYQDVVDRFASGGQVADNVVRQVWQNTTQGHTVWDVPIYEAFFRAVRELNASRPKMSQLRVLLGDPPTDWENVRGWDDVARPMANYARDRHPADLIRREVLAKGRRALIIYGDGHLWRHAGFPTLVSLLEESTGTNVFTIGSANLADLGAVQPNADSWPAPRIAVVKDTVLGVKEFSHYFPVPPGNDELRSLRLQDQVDAIAYYGPRKTLTTSELSPALCGDSVYMKMRLGRMLWVPPGAPNLGEQLKQYCARVAPK